MVGLMRTHAALRCIAPHPPCSSLRQMAHGLLRNHAGSAVGALGCTAWLLMWVRGRMQATLQDIAPDAWGSTKDTYISGVSSAANVDAKWVKVTGVSKSAPLVVGTQARLTARWHACQARVGQHAGATHRALSCVSG